MLIAYKIVSPKKTTPQDNRIILRVTSKFSKTHKLGSSPV